jgi:hypothetical protein
VYKPPLPKAIDDILRKWGKMSIALRAIHAILVFAATVSSLFVAANIYSEDRALIAWIAFIAAISTGLLTGLDIGSKSNRARRAWRNLNAPVMKYKHENDFTIEQLIKAHEGPEEIIVDVKELPASTGK